MSRLPNRVTRLVDHVPLFDPDRLTADGMPRDCDQCTGVGRRLVIAGDAPAAAYLPCKNCGGTGRAKIPF